MTKDFTAIDIETVGLFPYQEIIELGAVRYRDGQPVDYFNEYICYDQKLPAKIVEVTGITDETLAQKGIPKKKALCDFLIFLGDDILVAHNMPFDWTFICYHSALLKCDHPLNNQRICTLELAKTKEVGTKNKKLSTLCDHFGIVCDKYHSAIHDAKAAGDLFLKLQEI